MVDQNVVLYHHPCNDGFAALFALHRHWNLEYTAIGVNYNQEIPQEVIEGGKRLIILDFSYPVDVFETFKDNWENILVIDHHKKMIDEYYERGYLKDKQFHFGNAANNHTLGHMFLTSMEHSGAYLAYLFFSDKSLAKGDLGVEHDDNWLFKYVQDRDLWQHKLSATEEVNTMISLLHKLDNNKDREAFTKCMQAWEHCYKLGRESLIIQGTGAVAYRNMLLDTHMPHVEVTTLFTEVEGVKKEYTVGLVSTTSPQLISDLGNRICKETNVDQRVDFAAIDNIHGNSVSLRSIGDVDVNEVAKIFGGGGHKNAAGCKKDILGYLL